jgi:hypothetical protein
MDADINATHTSSSWSTFYAYADYTAEQVPSLWMPFFTSIDAVSNDLHNATWSPFLTYYPQYWTCSTATCGTH